MMIKVHAMYESGTRCTCGSRQFDVRRTTAECVKCKLPLPIENAEPTSSPIIWRRGDGGGSVSRGR